MTCSICGGNIVIAPNIFGKVVTFHEVPSTREGYITHTELTCN